jgi:hypothetical protein
MPHSYAQGLIGGSKAQKTNITMCGDEKTGGIKWSLYSQL